MSVHIDTLTLWFTQHPFLTTFLVFLAAATESLIVVGIIVPGAAIMVAAGILIGLDKLAFWPTMVAAILGAISGDSISYWIGHFYKERLRTFWPFRTHPHWLPKVEDFFYQHGGKSVLFGRFVGPVRPFIPAVAGMLGMSPLKFYLVNVSSAIAWAPAYLFPGMAFGASLAMASLVATRLVMFLVIVLAVLVVIVWLSKRLYGLLAPKLNDFFNGFIDWSLSHKLAGNFIRGLVDSEQSAVRPLIFFAVLTITTAALFFTVFTQAVSTKQINGFDQNIYQLMQALRTSWGDHVMVFFTQIGATTTLILFSLSLLLWLFWKRCWLVIVYWLAAIGFGKLTIILFQLDTRHTEQLTGNYDGLVQFSFPSSHTAMSMVTYGLIAIFIAHKAKPRIRWVYYAATVALVFMIALSRLYLGTQWTTDVIAGLCLGGFWISLLAVAYFRHVDRHPLPQSFTRTALIIFVAVTLIQTGWHYQQALQQNKPKTNIVKLNQQDWLESGWRQLPAQRVDFDSDNQQPLNIQWQGNLDAIRHSLQQQGWKISPALNSSDMLRWLAPDYPIAQMPFLPQFHAGRADVLTMTLTKKKDQKTTTAVLRLWSNHTLLIPGDRPLWIGSVAYADTTKILFLNLPQTSGQYRSALATLHAQLDKMHIHYELKSRKNGPVLLVQSAAVKNQQ